MNRRTFLKGLGAAGTAGSLASLARTVEGAAVARLRARVVERDPIAFAASCGFPDLDPWQRELLTADWRQALLNCSRQAGKSSAASLLGLYEAVEHGRLVLLLAPALRQSTELMRKVKDAYRTLADRERVPAIAEESVLKLEFANGGRVLSLPGRADTIRGFSGVGLLVVDEASWVPDDVYYAIRPMLAVSGGRIINLSTPFGRRGFFFKEWAEGGSDWHRVEIPAEQCPRIPKDWLAEERKRIGEWWYSQEYENQFVDTTDQVFRYEDVQAAYDDDVSPLALPVYGS